MPHPIGFILLTHNKPHQMHRLITRLNKIFWSPPIVCHHDFHQCDMSVQGFPKNVSFVQPSLQTRWADFSVVEATVRAIRLLYANAGSPDWFVLLSGSDYPIAPAERVIEDLNNGTYDAHIHSELICRDVFERDWQRQCYNRYCTKSFGYPSLTRRGRLVWKSATIQNYALAKWFLPFSDTFKCYAGSQWFCANRQAAERVVEFHCAKPALACHYRSVMFSEESYFQCIIANDPQLTISNCNCRYIDWTAGGAHPKLLNHDDLSKILSSRCHFARKFDSDQVGDVLDAIDLAVDDVSRTSYG